MFSRVRRSQRHRSGHAGPDPNKGPNLSTDLSLIVGNPQGPPRPMPLANQSVYLEKGSLYSEDFASLRRDSFASSASSSFVFGTGLRRVAAVDNNVMASTVERSRHRRERTFVGSECAVCEEPLEHTLQGERILQFSCSHVSHEACFYEFIREVDSQHCPTCDAPLHLDTSRGGNVIDINKMSTMMRSDSRSAHTPTPSWDNQTVRSPSIGSSHKNLPALPALPVLPYGPAQKDLPRGHSSREPSDRYGPSRHDSEVASSGYPETAQSAPARRHDYDLQAMETSPGSPRPISRNPIPPPTITVRSEFPTLTRSRQQQTLTCLITVEAASNKWRPDLEDLGVQPLQVPSLEARVDDAMTRQPVAMPAPLYPYESADVLEEMAENLRHRVDSWHGLIVDDFGPLRLYGTLRVGKNKVSWQVLECYLFAKMLICVKEKKQAPQWDDNGIPQRTATVCTLKGSILIKKHLNDVVETGTIDENVLTLTLSAGELPQFHLKFDNRNQLKLWNQALVDLITVDEPSSFRISDYDHEISETEDDVDWNRSRSKRVSSTASSWGPKSATTAPTEYTSFTARSPRLGSPMHVPIDVVVVVPISSSMQGVKINLVRDALKFMIGNLGERDRLGIVTFGSASGGTPMSGMMTKSYADWPKVLASIKPVGQKSPRADVVEGANVAMDQLMERKHSNPIATIMLISDASTADPDSVDFVVSRAEAAKITIHSFGLGTSHKPDTMIELSTRTKASYTYVKDWMMLRECLAGCLGGLQTLSHQNVKLKLKLPEGSPAKFHKISGALQITKRATGRDAEASLGDLRFGDKRDVLVQLVITPDSMSQDQLPQDPWDNIVSGLEALGGSVEAEADRIASVEEVPLVQADLSWGDILRDGTVTQMPRPSLLTVTGLPAPTGQKKAWATNAPPPIPPHPSIVQRRMELLTSDMLTRALTLVSRGQHDRAHTLLNETRSILKGLGKGGLPPVPPPRLPTPLPNSTKSAPTTPHHVGGDATPHVAGTPDRKRSPSPPTSTASSTSSGNSGNGFSAGRLARSRSTDHLGGVGRGIDPGTVAALDAELESSLEWINHPAVFARDSRKAVLQAIGVISSQRAFTFRSPIESLWAGRVGGIKRLADKSREWREEGGGEGGIMEEA
ncbi:hypothetical protein GQ602_006524 [Ophiocordyceps camponoti-floridani]|uniref:RING-type domain-containing protein n=1 Tax=Ophiocordyceps camponoti-floridani TaxID=2030778 RepID=A0A8H4Q1D1_9HYPO|nr:hypothetical protein GQ602_006524 [Ophiocordyceps camponoti-floridani]